MGSSIPVDLFDDGVLWAINRVLFHPRGFALAVDSEDNSFYLQGDGSEVWAFEYDTDDAKFIQFESCLERASQQNGGDQRASSAVE